MNPTLPDYFPVPSMYRTIGSTLAAILLLFVLSLLVVGDVSARRSLYDEPHDAPLKNIEEKVWEEETADLPGFPKDENLLEFQVDQPGSKFRYFIDTASISVGEDDGVVRYTLVIRSKSGGQNVMFEAMHCTERQYKTFAYGTSKGEFRPLRKPRWRSIRETSNVRYRRDLCAISKPGRPACRNRSSMPYVIPERIGRIQGFETSTGHPRRSLHPVLVSLAL